jgi:hypothetical protein
MSLISSTFYYLMFTTTHSQKRSQFILTCEPKKSIVVCLLHSRQDQFHKSIQFSECVCIFSSPSQIVISMAMGQWYMHVWQRSIEEVRHRRSVTTTDQQPTQYLSITIQASQIEMHRNSSSLHKRIMDRPAHCVQLLTFIGSFSRQNRQKFLGPYVWIITMIWNSFYAISSTLWLHTIFS